MTFLGLERPVEYGREQVFDPTTAQMVLNANRDYINAVYNDYRQALADMKEFNKEYGDFLSPIQADMDWYNKNVTGRVRNFINDLYARGIDPLRSAEGRALVTRELANMPTGQIAQLRQSAETAKDYIKAAAALAAEGRYDPEAERFFGRDLSTWNTLGDPDNKIAASGVWGAASPIKSQTMDEIIEPIIKNLDYTYDAERTKQANDGNDYYTVTEDRIRATINDAMSDLTRRNTMGGYYYNQALQQTGDPDKARELYTQWLVNRGKDHLKEKFTPNKYKEMEYEYKLKSRLENQRHANAMRENGYQQQQTGDYDFAADMYDTMLNNIAGAPSGYQWKAVDGNLYNATKYFDGTDSLINAQYEYGRSVKGSNNVRAKFRERYTHQKDLPAEVLAGYLRRDIVDKVGNRDFKGMGMIRIQKGDVKNLKTTSSMITNTAGYTKNYYAGDEKEQELLTNVTNHPEKYMIGGSFDMYGAGQKRGRFENDAIVKIYDTSGNYEGELALDTHINSVNTSGGWYFRNKHTTANTARDLKHRSSVDAGSTEVNNKIFSTSRSQNMPDMFPNTTLISRP